MKKINIIIIAIALLFGTGQCKKQEVPETPETPGVIEGNMFHISVNVNEGSRHIVYPESGAYVFENGDKLYVGNNGHYIGTLEYYDGAFSGDIEIADTCAAAYKDYLHFYFIGGAYTGELYTPSATNPTRSFEWSIADQTGSKLPILSYGHSTQKYSKKVSAYSCMLENKCGLVKFWAWPTPSTSNTLVTISGMKTTAIIDFANPGITTKDETGEVKLHKISGSDPAERWAILLPQSSVSDATVSYKDEDNHDIAQTIFMPAIKANTYYGGYNGISVGLEYVDLGLSVQWAACNVGSCTHEGYGKFFAWAETAPKTAYCWSKYRYAEDPDPYDGDTIHWEWDSTYLEPDHQIKLKPNLWLTKYNTQETWLPENQSSYDNKTTLESSDDAALAIMGAGWRIPTVDEWNELITGTTQTRAEVNGIGGVWFTSKAAGNNNSIFLPFAGVYSGPQHSAYYTSGNLPVGEYWSKEINSEKPYQAYSLYFDDPEFSGGGGDMEHLGVKSADDSGSDDVGFIRNEGRPVRAVRAR